MEGRWEKMVKKIDWLPYFIRLSKGKDLGLSPVDSKTPLQYIFMEYGNGYGNLIIWDSVNKCKVIMDRALAKSFYKSIPLESEFLPDYSILPI